MNNEKFARYVDVLASATKQAQATDRGGKDCAPDAVVEWVIKTARAAHDRGNKLIFAGNVEAPASPATWRPTTPRTETCVPGP